MNNNYQGLRAVGKILQAVAWIALALGIIGAIVLYSRLGSILPELGGGGRFAIALIFLLSFGLTNFFQLYIIGGLLGVFTDIAQQGASRGAALERLTQAISELKPPAPTPPSPPPPPPPAS